jgi:hypothetical protein
MQKRFITCFFSIRKYSCEGLGSAFSSTVNVCNACVLLFVCVGGGSVLCFEVRERGEMHEKQAPLVDIYISAVPAHH